MRRGAVPIPRLTGRATQLTAETSFNGAGEHGSGTHGVDGGEAAHVTEMADADRTADGDRTAVSTRAW